MRGLELRVENLEVKARGRLILHDVSFSCQSGDILLVVGASGAGKTTLLRVLAGVSSLYNYSVSGLIHKPSKVAYVPQEPWTAISTPYAWTEMSFYGHKPEALRRLRVDPESPAVSMSAGELMRTLVLEAIESKSNLILVDEASSYLDYESRLKLRDLLVEAASRGAIVVVVDHDLELWANTANKTLYLADGRAIEYSDPRETPIYEAYMKLSEKLEKPRASSGDVVISIDNLWYKPPDSNTYILKAVSFKVKSGEIVWVKGASGKGKTTLLKLITGMLKPTSGIVKLKTRPHLVPENPLLYLSEPQPLLEVRGDSSLLELAGLKDRARTPIMALSSGERRRLAIVSAYSHSPKALLVDEPTVGLDPWNAVRVLRLLVSLAERGAAVIVASHGRELELVASKIIELT